MSTPSAMPLARPSWMARWMARLTVVQCGWALLVFVLWVGAMSRLPVDADYTAGELLDHMLAWRSGEPLYSDPTVAPYRVLNYPPTGLAAVRAAAAIHLDPLLAGRLLGTLGIVVALAILYRWLRDDGLSPRSALTTVALSGASFPMLYSAGQFHIEGCAVAATLAGYRYAARPGRSSAWIAGGLLAVACLVKQTEVIPALVALGWMARYRRQDVASAAVALVAVGGAGVAAITVLFGGEAWRQLISYTVGSYSVSGLGWQLLQHALPWAPLAALAFGEARRVEERGRDIRWWYLVGSTVWLLSAARLGAGYPYFLDWQFAVLLWIGPALHRVAQQAGAGQVVPRRWMVALFVCYVLVSDIVVGGILGYDVRTGQRTAAALEVLCPMLPVPPALTITESPGIARACGARSALHPFIIANLTRRGLWDERPFLRDIMDARYPVLLLPFDPAEPVTGVHRDRWSPSVLDAMSRLYHPVRQEGGWWLMEFSIDRH